MPETKRPLKVFLSYASQDKPVVQQLSRRLVGEGWIDAWLDVKKLLPGQDWRIKIEEAVETSDIVIICLSSNSVSKEGYVQKELRYAREIALEKPEETFFLIPLRLDECEVPRGLRFYQWVDYFGERKDESYNALIESLKLRYEQKLKLEEAERARKEKRESENAKGVAREKEEREAAERITKEETAREQAKKGSEEKAHLAAEEQARQKTANQQTEQEKAKRDAVARGKREREERQVASKATITKVLSYFSSILKLTVPKVKPIVRVVSIIGAIIILFWIGSWGISKLTSIVPSAIPSATVTLIPPTKTHTLTPTRTHLPILTPSFTPTVTLTPTPVPTNSILFQRDFENGSVGAWSYVDGTWTVEQEPDGNHCMLGSGPVTSTPQIWYRSNKTHWMDYALETRVKFINGRTLYMLMRSDVGSDDHYGLALNENGLGLMRTWKTLGNIFSMQPVQDKWYTFRVEINGNFISEYMDDHLVQGFKLYGSIISQGGFGYIIGDDVQVCFDDIKVWSLK